MTGADRRQRLPDLDPPSFELSKHRTQSRLIRRANPFRRDDLSPGRDIESMFVMRVGLPFPFIGMRVVIAKDRTVFQVHNSSMKPVLQHPNAPHFAEFEKVADLQVDAISAK
jgi:hypothetical protein